MWFGRQSHGTKCYEMSLQWHPPHFAWPQSKAAAETPVQASSLAGYDMVTFSKVPVFSLFIEESYKKIPFLFLSQLAAHALFHVSYQKSPGYGCVQGVQGWHKNDAEPRLMRKVSEQPNELAERCKLHLAKCSCWVQ